MLIWFKLLSNKETAVLSHTSQLIRSNILRVKRSAVERIRNTEWEHRARKKWKLVEIVWRVFMREMIRGTPCLLIWLDPGPPVESLNAADDASRNTENTQSHTHTSAFLNAWQESKAVSVKYDSRDVRSKVPPSTRIDSNSWIDARNIIWPAVKPFGLKEITDFRAFLNLLSRIPPIGPDVPTADPMEEDANSHFRERFWESSLSMMLVAVGKCSSNDVSWWLSNATVFSPWGVGVVEIGIGIGVGTGVEDAEVRECRDLIWEFDWEAKDILLPPTSRSRDWERESKGGVVAAITWRFLSQEWLTDQKEDSWWTGKAWLDSSRQRRGKCDRIEWYQIS